jgi:hypothetical protein
MKGTIRSRKGHRMSRRWISAAVGVAVSLALLGVPASARSAPVTKIGLALYASEVSEGTPLIGVVRVRTRVGTSWVPLPGADLRFLVDGVQVGTGTSGADGRAPLSYPAIGVGLHTLKVKYAGDADHAKAQRAREFTVTEGSGLPAPPLPTEPPPTTTPPPTPTEPPPTTTTPPPTTTTPPPTTTTPPPTTTTPPPVPPGAPTIVIAEAAAPGLVYLEWQAPANTTVTGYRIYRGTQSGGETFRASKGATAFSFADVQVSPGVTYYYVVTALSAAGESAWSNEVVVTAT